MSATNRTAKIQARNVLLRFWLPLFGLLATMAPVSSYAGQAGATQTLFGPETFGRTAGPPTIYRRSFPVDAAHFNLGGPFILTVQNNGVTSGTIQLNGSEIVGPDELKKGAATIEKVLQVRANNALVVELRSKPGTSLTLTISGPFFNTIPVAVASVLSAPAVWAVGQEVKLDGTGSSDADGDALTFNWELSTKPPGSNSVPSDPAGSQPTFVIDQPGTYEATLFVADGWSSSVPATVTVVVPEVPSNLPPVVRITAPPAVTVGQTVVLDARATTDPEGDFLYYQWNVTGPSGNWVGASDPYGPKTSFTPDAVGSYEARLSVYDGTVDVYASVGIQVSQGLPGKPTLIRIDRVNQVPIDNQTVEETYTAEVQNDGHDRTNMEAVMISAPSNVEIIKGNLSFGNLAAGASGASIDVFTIRHPGSQTITQNDLGWNVFSDPVPLDLPPQVGGISMPGNPAQAAIDAYRDYRDLGRYQDSDVSNDADGNPVLRTVIDAEIDRDATVDDVNQLLESSNARIVEMTEGANWLGLLIPDPGSLDALNTIVDTIKMSLTVVDALPRYLPAPEQLPSSTPLTPDATNPNFMIQPEIAHHLAVKGAAAWNARGALDYPGSCIPFLIVADGFGQGLSGPSGDFENTSMDVLNPDAVAARPVPTEGHGYHVSGILAGQFTDAPGPYSRRDRVTGMFPQSPTGSRFPTLLLDRYNPLYAKIEASIAGAIQAIENNSEGYGASYRGFCSNGFPRRIVVNASFGLAKPRAEAAEKQARNWAALIRRVGRIRNAIRENNFAIFGSAGNGYGLPARDGGGFKLIGLTDIPEDPRNPTGPDRIPRFMNTGVVENRPAVNKDNGYIPRPQLSASSNVGGNLSAIGSLGNTQPPPGTSAPGTSVTITVSPPDLRSSQCTSFDDPDGIFSFVGPAASQTLRDTRCYSGTSMASPQVAGLAAYLWALRSQWGSATLLNHIINNGEWTDRDDPATYLQGEPVIDAYAAILSADQASAYPDTDLVKQFPVRLAILDIANGIDREVPDRKFDLHDAKKYVDKLFPADPNNSNRLAPEPTKPDYSRYDLNGDGYTGGINHAARFNLDTDYDASGGSVYSTVGIYDEKGVTDFGILCYYVHSPLFQSAPGAGIAEFDQHLRNLSSRFSQAISCPSGLNDTGITGCSAGSAASIACPVAEYPGQDAEFGRDKTSNDESDGHAGFSFTKIAADGAALPVDAASWSCIRDNVTGLMWEVKTADGGLHDKTRTFTNFSLAFSSVPPGLPFEGGYGDSNDAAGFVADVNYEGLCGADDWRLPTADELQTIVDYSVAPPGPTIDQRFFLNSETTIAGQYTRYNIFFWSSEPWLLSGGFYPEFPDVWMVDFTTGHFYHSDRFYRYSLRLVRPNR